MVEITLTGSDVDGNSLTFATGTASHGTVSLAGAVATYTPAANYNGPDSFTFTVNDGTVSSTPATVTITVTPENDFIEWTAQHSVASDPAADPDNDLISNAVEYVIGGNPANGMDVDLLPTDSIVVADPDGNSESSEYLRFTYRHALRAKNNPSTVIKVEWSTDLAPLWTDASGTTGVVVEVTNDGFEPGVERVDVYLPRSLAVDGGIFVRLSVTITPP